MRLSLLFLSSLRDVSSWASATPPGASPILNFPQVFFLPQIGDSLCLKLSDLLPSAHPAGSATWESSKHFKKYMTRPGYYMYSSRRSHLEVKEREREKSTMRLLVTGDDSCQAVVPKNLNQTANHLAATRTFLGLWSRYFLKNRQLVE